MGAKQSKRSVDISGKEAESAGEVAASIAGGEGRVEPLADADALKPQLNGDAHIHDTEEKQKDIDSGTPENEKDATTEKETKQQEEEKEVAPLTNGESEPKVENGESTPTPEDGKKPKKEKVKKKWSLRSISFSRKDKPKQEKKPKDEEPKTNGESEKVPEETAEIAAEVPVVTEIAEEAKTPTEVKEDKTPETPVTEPITNGSSTPETPKVETPVVEEPAAPSSENETPESKTEVEPEQLPVNGLSLEEPTKETTENGKNEDSKEELTAETAESVPEIPVKKEVCVEQMPLIDSKPPPLPANPPPSSVASFAATTMAPELSDASLANTADNAILPPPSPPSAPIVKDELDEIVSKSEINLTVAQTVSNELSSPVKKDSEITSEPATENEVEHTKDTTGPIESNKLATVDNVKNESEIIEKSLVETETVSDNLLPKLPSPPQIVEDESSLPSHKEFQPEIPAVELTEEVIVESLENVETEVLPPPPELIEEIETEKVLEHSEIESTVSPVEEPVIEKEVEIEDISCSEMPATPPQVFVVPDEPNTVESLPDPPPPIHDEAISVLENNSVPENSEITSDVTKVIVNSNNVSGTEEINHQQVEHNNDDENLDINSIKKSKESLGNVNEIIECNGNIKNETEELKSQSLTKESEELTSAAAIDIVNSESDRTAFPMESPLPSPPAEASAAGDSEALPSPPSELCASPQEPLPISDKLADLISEVPEVPDLKIETLQVTTSDATVAN